MHTVKTREQVARVALEYMKALCRHGARGDVAACAERPGVVHVLSGAEELDVLKALGRKVIEEDEKPSEELRTFFSLGGRQSEATFEAALVAIVDALAPEVPRTKEAMGPWLAGQAGVNYG